MKHRKKEFYFDDLSEQAKYNAASEYMFDWNENRKNDKLDLDDVYSILRCNDEYLFNSNGEYLGIEE